MVVSEFIKWLKTQPQDAIVTCISHTSGNNYYEQGGTIDIVDMRVEPSFEGAYDETFELIDFRKDYFKDLTNYGKVFLFIGRKE